MKIYILALSSLLVGCVTTQSELTPRIEKALHSQQLLTLNKDQSYSIDDQYDVPTV